jgi:hypothetical protein
MGDPKVQLKGAITEKEIIWRYRALILDIWWISMGV